VADKRHGAGTMEMATGVYSGEWKDDKVRDIYLVERFANILTVDSNSATDLDCGEERMAQYIRVSGKKTRSMVAVY